MTIEVMLMQAAIEDRRRELRELLRHSSHELGDHRVRKHKAQRLATRLRRMLVRQRIQQTTQQTTTA